MNSGVGGGLAASQASRWVVILGPALAIAGAIVGIRCLDQPLWFLALAGAACLAFGTRALVRRHGLLGCWTVALGLSILLGEMSAIGFGGQSGRLLWVDLVLALGVGSALLGRDFVVQLPRAPILWTLVPWVAWSAATLLFARDVLTGIAELKEWLVALVAAVVAVGFAADTRRAQVLLATVAWTAALVAVLMVVSALQSPLGWVLAVLFKKVDLPWGRTNYLAGILILGIPVTCGLLGYAATGRARLYALLLLLVQAAGLALSASKGAILALTAGLLIGFGRGSRALRLGVWTMLGIIAVGVGLFTVGPLHRVVEYRLQSTAVDYSVSERMDLYRLGWESFVRSPIVGLGLNNFSVASKRLTGVDTVPHNLELGLLAETGVAGLILAFVWIIVFGRAAWRGRHPSLAPGERALGLGVWAAFLAFFFHNQIESTLYGEQYKILLMFVAAAASRLGSGILHERGARSAHRAEGAGNPQGPR